MCLLAGRYCGVGHRLWPEERAWRVHQRGTAGVLDRLRAQVHARRCLRAQASV